MKKQKMSRLTQALLETAGDMRRAGVLAPEAHAKITKRHLGSKTTALLPISADEIRDMRICSRMSQSVFARCLNVTTGYVSQLERGAKKPTGSTLALLNVIQRKGIEAIL
jgi:putative transcriptional regulator